MRKTMKILKSHHFLWFLKSKQQQENPKPNNTHKKKGASTTRMSTAEQGCDLKNSLDVAWSTSLRML